MQTLAIYGSGGLGREILDLARAAKPCGHIVFLNDFDHGSVIHDTEVLSFDGFSSRFDPGLAKVVIAVGEPKVRQKLREKVTQNGYELYTLVSPSALVGSGTELGAGTIIQFGSFISPDVKIGDNTLIQFNSSLGHDCVVGSDSVISTCVSVSGGCVIGDRTYIAINVPLKEQTRVGSDTIIGMGSAVMRDIPDKVIALGNPARVIRNNDDGTVFR